MASVEAPETTAATTTVPANTAQQYDIAETGSVWVLATRSGIALDHVVVDEGWTSALSQSDPRVLRVDFTNGGRTIVFTAELGNDGAVLVDVTEPTTVVGSDAGGCTGRRRLAGRRRLDADHRHVRRRSRRR